MSYKTILVLADHSRAGDGAIAVAAGLAISQQAHLIGLASTGIARYLHRTSLFPPGVPVQVDDLGYFRDRADKELAEFDTITRRLGLASCETRRIDEEFDEGLALHGRYCDLIVIGQPKPDQAGPSPQEGLPQHLLLQSATPVLIVPYAGKVGRTDQIGRHIVVAWDGGIEASRAISAALPLLRRAAKVTLAIFNPGAGFQVHGDQPGADMALYLARHGIVVEVRRQDTPFDVGNELLTLSADIGADLLVMGGYGHMRWPAMVLGGTTRTILQSMTVPVLMAH
ncbi:universal stress protein [Oxalobacteraceae bacterium]|nr:universal stress protein [Oxalobacteraceae bacterium]